MTSARSAVLYLCVGLAALCALALSAAAAPARDSSSFRAETASFSSLEHLQTHSLSFTANTTAVRQTPRFVQARADRGALRRLFVAGSCDSKSHRIENTTAKAGSSAMNGRFSLRDSKREAGLLEF